MTKEEIAVYIKELILENLSVQISINHEAYTDDSHYFKVTIEYDGTEINSYGDSVRIPQ